MGSKNKVSENDIGRQIRKTQKVADMLCSGHAQLRDRYRFRSSTLDILLLVFSILLVSQTFASDLITPQLSLFGVSSQYWLGILSICVFTLSMIQLRVDWKAKAHAHAKSFSLYAEVKRELGYLILSQDIDPGTFGRVMTKYDLAGDLGTHIPEKEFLAQKQKHRIKVQISEILDSSPAAPIWLTRFKLFLDHTFGTTFIGK